MKRRYMDCPPPPMNSQQFSLQGKFVYFMDEDNKVCRVGALLKQPTRSRVALAAMVAYTRRTEELWVTEGVLMESAAEFDWCESCKEIWVLWGKSQEAY